MPEFKAHFEETLSFIREYQSLVDCHLVDFLTKNLWDKCLPAAMKLELETVDFSDFDEKGNNYEFKKLANISSELQLFLKSADSLSLKKGRSITNLDNSDALLSESKCEEEIAKKKSMNFMSEKKEHEIMIFDRLVGKMVKENEINLIIDAGSGKGYLSTSISQNYRIPVLAMDSSETNVRGAIDRRKMIQRKKNEKLDLVHYYVQHIDEETDYEKIIQNEFGEWKRNNNCILTGLHTCGQLAHSVIRHFLNVNCLKCLCIVPCCYHLTDESLTGVCNLTKNARMLAQQSVERSESKEMHISQTRSLFYRALLQIILQSLGIPDRRIGRKVPIEDFPTYARAALTKIGVDSQRIPTMESLIGLYETYSSSRWKFHIFQSIRIYLGSVIEAAVILDRVIYMQTSNQCSKVDLIKLFDPLISPRCYAIVALK